MTDQETSAFGWAMGIMATIMMLIALGIYSTTPTMESALGVAICVSFGAILAVIGFIVTAIELSSEQSAAHIVKHCLNLGVLIVVLIILL